MDRDDIVSDLSEHYNKNTLTTIAFYMGQKPPESLNKLELSDFLVDRLSDKKNYLILYRAISREAQIVLKHLVWYGISTLRHIESINHIKVTVDDYYGNSNDEFINLFKSYSIKEIQLSTGLRELFKRHIPKPKSAEIVFGLYKRDLKIVSGNDYILNNLDAIYDFISQEGIRTRGIDKKILLKSIKKFSDRFQFIEAFTSLKEVDKESYTISTDILLRFLMLYHPHSSNIETLTKILSKYRNGSLVDENIDYKLFYPFIKGLNKNYNIHIFLKRARYSVLHKIKQLRTKEWIDIHSLILNLSFLEETQIFDTSFFGSLLSLKVDKEYTRDYATEIKLILKEDNINYLITPLVKGIILLLHVIGAVDLAIAEAETTNKIKSDKRGLTAFDNIFYFRLTDLGFKLLGLKSNYKEKCKEAELIFHKELTMVTIKGNSTKHKNFFKRVGNQIGEGVFLITFSSFFKECITEEDLDYNIRELMELLRGNMHDVWDNFLTDLNDRINPVYNEQELLVVNFPKDNKIFIDTILNNDKIRSLFTMVEGFKGAFSQKNYKLFVKQMKEEGFLI